MFAALCLLIDVGTWYFTLSQIAELNKDLCGIWLKSECFVVIGLVDFPAVWVVVVLSLCSVRCCFWCTIKAFLFILVYSKNLIKIKWRWLPKKMEVSLSPAMYPKLVPHHQVRSSERDKKTLFRQINNQLHIKQEHGAATFLFLRYRSIMGIKYI